MEGAYPMVFGGGEATGVMDAVRLNYTINEELEADLSTYCELTGRTASDVVRQLMCEVLEEDRTLPLPTAIMQFDRNGPRRDRRTDMWVPSRALRAFDEKLDAEGYPSKSAVIAYLLNDFLTTRGNHGVEEIVRTTVFVNRVTYARMGAIGAANGKTAEQVMAEVCEAHARTPKSKG